MSRARRAPCSLHPATSIHKPGQPQPSPPPGRIRTWLSRRNPGCTSVAATRISSQLDRRSSVSSMPITAWGRRQRGGTATGLGRRPAAGTGRQAVLRDTSAGQAQMPKPLLHGGQSPAGRLLPPQLTLWLARRSGSRVPLALAKHCGMGPAGAWRARRGSGSGSAMQEAAQGHRPGAATAAAVNVQPYYPAAAPPAGARGPP